IAGFLFVGAGIYYSYSQLGTTAGNVSIAGSVVLLAVAVWIFLRRKTLERISLKAKIDSSIGSVEELNIHAGDTGIALSRLAPMGKVKVNGQTIEAKSVDEFIDEGTPILVKEVFKTNVLVERISENSNNEHA
ncbi:MAG TPA: NfeD family protein, partial [Paludibacteraceae bacterium]|nr:NfeD family protein [Paludibacteraceae bacterium]